MNQTNQVYLEELKDWLRIPSISGDPKFKPDMKRASDWLVEKLKTLGFEARTMKTSLHPVVYGELRAVSTQSSGSRGQSTVPTILIYGHYDVQSPDPLEEWKSEPFEPVEKNGNLYARGVADDKGQLYTWISAIDQLLSQKKELPFNIKILVEGAEEEGSEGLAEFVAEHKDLLQADICVLSDSHSLSPTQPLITYGLRGLVYFEVTVQALKADAHSGLYGGTILNAATVLTQMISRLKNEAHEIQIPGFYDNVRKISKSEKIELSEFPWSIEDIKIETGAQVVTGEKNRSIAERVGARPTLDINGIWGGFQGEGGKTIIPAKASAKISMRLVADQKPERISRLFTDYFTSLAPKGVEITIKVLHSAQPVLLNRDSGYFKKAEEAMKKVFGNPPVYELSGGSIGVVADFKKILGIDSILMGYGLPDDGLHSPNEKLSLEMFEKGIETNTYFLKLLAESSHEDLKSH